LSDRSDQIKETQVVESSPEAKLAQEDNREPVQHDNREPVQQDNHEPGQPDNREAAQTDNREATQHDNREPVQPNKNEPAQTDQVVDAQITKEQQSPIKSDTDLEAPEATAEPQIQQSPEETTKKPQIKPLNLAKVANLN
jgi:hypothetical protein